jgi:hypothetical protein
VPFISATVSHGTRIEQSAAGDEKGGQMDTQKDQDKPSRSSNMEKGKGDRKSEWGEGTSEGAGASNRPMDEEIGNQKSDVRKPTSDR